LEGPETETVEQLGHELLAFRGLASRRQAAPGGRSGSARDTSYERASGYAVTRTIASQPRSLCVASGRRTRSVTRGPGK